MRDCNFRFGQRDLYHVMFRVRYHYTDYQAGQLDEEESCTPSDLKERNKYLFDRTVSKYIILYFTDYLVRPQTYTHKAKTFSLCV